MWIIEAHVLQNITSEHTVIYGQPTKTYQFLWYLSPLGCLKPHIVCRIPLGHKEYVIDVPNPPLAFLKNTIPDHHVFTLGDGNANGRIPRGANIASRGRYPWY